MSATISPFGSLRPHPSARLLHEGMPRGVGTRSRHLRPVVQAPGVGFLSLSVVAQEHTSDGPVVLRQGQLGALGAGRPMPPRSVAGR